MKKTIYILATVLASFTAKAQDHLDLLRQRVDSVVQTAIRSDLIPGAVVQIQKDGKIIYSKAYGLSQKYDIHHQVLQSAPSMNTTTLFDLASLTKVVGTTTSLMVLADQHKLSVDDPVSKFLPGFDSGEKKQVTLRHLLTHTAGLYEWYPLYYRSAHRDSTIAFIESLPLHFPVGKQRKYSDLGFMLLGAIIEKVSGLPLDQFEAQYVFKPLGMVHTGFNPLQHGRTTDIAATSLGQPYEYRMTHDTSLGFIIPGLDLQSWNGWRQYVLKGEVNDGNSFYSSEGISGAAGLFSTVEDLQKLVNMLLNQGMTGQRQFISEATIRNFLTPDTFHNGLGWMMDPANAFMKNAPAGTFGHTGFTGTSISVVPAENLSVVILINRQNIGLQPNGAYYNPNPVRQGVFEAVMRTLAVSK
jgi:CubicO group peptidase (beta-lactamase class C family)